MATGIVYTRYAYDWPAFLPMAGYNALFPQIQEISRT